MRVSWPSSLLTGLTLLSICGTAGANGRFPRAQRLIEDTTDPSRLAIYGTYGLVTTSDAGKTWQYVCEGATGPFAGEAPLLELLPQGRVILNSETGLRGSSFPTCDWRHLLDLALPNAVQDITRDPSDEQALWALLSEPDAKLGARAALSRSSDGGETWAAELAVPGDVLGQGVTVDVAPSLPSRIYLSGLDDARNGVLARSDDAGATWTAFPIPETSSSELPYLAQIDAKDENRLFLRTDALKDHDGQLEPDDALLFSADGGASFVRVLSRRAKLLGFALSPDGETLLLGYGDPVLYAYTVEPEQTGLYRLRMTDLLADPTSAAGKLEKIFAGSVTCLRWTAHGLYACLAQAEQGFEAGRVVDAEFSLADAQPFEPLLDLKVLSPLACPESSSAGVCASDINVGWPAVCAKLGASCEAPATPSGTPPSDPAEASSKGCGCRAVGASRIRSNFGWILALGGAFLRVWRKRGRRLPDTNAR